MKYSENSLKKGEGVPLLNLEGGPGVPLLNFEEGPRVPHLNFEGGPGPPVPGSCGPGSRSPGPTFTPCQLSLPLHSPARISCEIEIK